jgi:glycosyl transferase, family 25
VKIFVINLKRSTYRRQKLEPTLKRLNLDYEFIEAVDGYKLTREELDSYIDPENKYPRNFKPGEVGCFLSHYLVHKKIVAEKLPFALVMEDDVELSANLPYLLKNLEQHIRPGDVISLYASFPERCNLYKDGTIDQNYSFIKPHKGELVVGNVAYIISYAAAKQMVEQLLPMHNVIDDWGYWCEQGYVNDFKIVFPHPVDLTDNYSDIHESQGSLLLKFKKYLVNQYPYFADHILMKRKVRRQAVRVQNIRIDGEKPNKIFY